MGVDLVDCTPDVREQLRLLRDVRFDYPGGVNRAPIDGVLLTHAHMGHYLGLAHLGYEAMHTHGVRAFASERMAGFLEENQPWASLIERGEIVVTEIRPGEAFEPGGGDGGSGGSGVAVTPIVVPHRDELSDTLAFRFKGPRATVLYMPDCDPWHRWQERALEILDSADVVIIDGSFFDGDELPGRDLSKIGHPLVIDTLALLGDRVARGELRVILTHMNHTNPLIEPDSEARARVLDAGFEIAIEGMEIPL